MRKKGPPWTGDGPVAAELSLASADTRSSILDIAERLVQRRGFNGFSYADIAREMGMTKAALHYHFPGKAELGESLVSRYAQRFEARLGAIKVSRLAWPGKLMAYCDIYRAVLEEQRMCLCGMLAAEYNTLPFAMQQAVTRFFEANEAWLVALLQQGRAAGAFRFPGPALQVARMVVAALEGAMLLAPPYGSSSMVKSVAAQLVAELGCPAAPLAPKGQGTLKTVPKVPPKTGRGTARPARASYAH